MTCRLCNEEKGKDCFRKQKGKRDNLCKTCYNRIYHGTQLENVESLAGEVWETISVAPFFMISNFRRIKCKSRKVKTRNGDRLIYEKLLTKRINKQTGYWEVGLTVSKANQKYFLVHRMVAKAFIPNPKNYPQVNHKDLDRSNDAIDNLEWCTQSQNANHAKENGRYIGVKGEKNKLSKLTKDKVVRIYFDNREYSQIANDYKICIGTVGRIKSKRTWEHITKSLN